MLYCAAGCCTFYASFGILIWHSMTYICTQKSAVNPPVANVFQNIAFWEAYRKSKSNVPHGISMQYVMSNAFLWHVYASARPFNYGSKWR